MSSSAIKTLPEFQSLTESLIRLIDAARIGNWEQVVILEPTITESLARFQLISHPGSENRAIFPVDREHLETINNLLAIAGPLCQSRRDLIAPLVSQLKPLQDTTGR